MITEDGKTQGGSEKIIQTDSGGISEAQIVEMLKEANEGLLKGIGAMIAGRLGVGSGSSQTKQKESRIEEDDSESLKDIAHMMAAGSSVDSTNFKSLGREEEITTEDSGKQDRTIDLLRDLPI